MKFIWFIIITFAIVFSNAQQQEKIEIKKQELVFLLRALDESSKLADSCQKELDKVRTCCNVYFSDIPGKKSNVPKERRPGSSEKSNKR